MALYLRENLTFDAARIVVEGSEEGKNLYMKGICIQGGVKNANERVYPVSEIEKAAAMPNCTGSFEPAAEGYGAMFNRNKKVAASAELVLAYTFGTGDQPADGGTKNTWDQCKGDRIHVPLPRNLI